VVIPLFDGERWIEDALRSVLAQSLADLEAIVVDDGSRDRGLARVEAVRDSRVVVLPRPHAGVAAARNAGVRAARAPLVGFLDQDDLLLPDHLQGLVAALADRPDRFAYAEAVAFGEGPDAPLSPPGAAPAATFRDLFAGSHLVTPGQVLARKADLLAAGLFPEEAAAQGSDDRGLWLALAARGVLPLRVPRATLRYRRHPAQASRRRVAALSSRLAVRARWADATAGDPPARLVPPEEAAAVLARIEADLAYALLDQDAAEAERVWASAVARRPAVASEPAGAAYRRKRRRKRLAALPGIGPFGRAVARLLRGRRS
jgi:glycosyltransferase involved in cell wall biosynthesis